jgi:hypothetical protein
VDDSPSLNAYVLPLAVARLHGHGRDAPDGQRVLHLVLDAGLELQVRARRCDGGWLASAALCHGTVLHEGTCPQPTVTPIQAEAVALVSLAQHSGLGCSLAHRMRKSLEMHYRSAVSSRFKGEAGGR